MPPENRQILRLVDAHYGGDVSRVVIDGVPYIPGRTVLEKRAWLEHEGDALRRMLLGSPYGDPSMCANVYVAPDIPEAEAGYVIMEAMGYPHFSGSNSICVVAALLENGVIEMGPAGTQEVLLEAPAGLIRAQAHHDGEHVESVTLSCDPPWVAARDCEVELPEYGQVRFDLVWSGCFYAVVDAERQGFALTAAERPSLAEFGLELCLVATPELDLVHPDFGDTGLLSFVCFAGPVEPAGDGPLPRSPSATFVYPHVVCRCPTGTGTAARLAVLADRGEAGVGEGLTTVSPTGSEMDGRIVGTTDTAGHDALEVTITGRPFTLGRTDLIVNLDDDLTGSEGIWELLTGDLPGPGGGAAPPPGQMP